LLLGVVKNKPMTAYPNAANLWLRKRCCTVPFLTEGI
jgi:hypothetical protein